ncbi:MAG: HD domain-containing phosphohydrolase [Mariprofundaceae bacterium]|nr:HD domain-containing phosphohydrolase [Mariprofundaceae bacterium]
MKHNVKHLIQRIKLLNEIGLSLSTERDHASLMEKILLGAKEITHADAGTLYILTPERTLEFVVVHTTSLNYHMGGTSPKPVSFAAIPLEKENGEANDTLVAVYTALYGKTVNVEDVGENKQFDFSGAHAFDKKTGYTSVSFLSIPMVNHEGDIIGVLQLLNAQNNDNQIIAFDHESQQFTESLASQAAIALSNKYLIEEMRELFESFIRLMAKAIDEKSPHTGEHCRRVPKLTLMLADAATKSDLLPDFSLDEKERYELEISSWLHDCGKVTSPVHIIEKSKKLQTIFDRIQLVEQRFELIKRDTEIQYLKACIDTPHQQAELKEIWINTTKQQESDFCFLKTCNTGSEYTTPETIQRIQHIAQRWQWTNNQGQQQTILTKDEVKNLSIVKGTLTTEERQLMNNHINVTIEMLESLPFPKHLKRVAQYAGAHHERVDGKGFPYGLKGETFPIPSRIMAIADVFEALTSSDRPYKKAMPLSKSIEILTSMASTGHIDPNIFQVFMQEKVYLEYAHAYLDTEQIDID